MSTIPLSLHLPRPTHWCKNVQKCQLDAIIDRFFKRISNWKAKALSFGGRLTLTKSVLGSLGVYYFFTFKAPKMVTNKLESIRRKFFWGGSWNSNKIAWIAWIAWKKVIRSIHGPQGGLHDVSFIKSKAGPWFHIAKLNGDLNKYGIDLQYLFKVKLGQLECVIDNTRSFTIGGMKSLITYSLTPLSTYPYTWNKLVPIKVNISSWRIKNNRIPTRVNLDNRGIDLHSTRCPVCDNDLETEEHILVKCNVAVETWCGILKWWNLHNTRIDNLNDIFSLASRSNLSPFHTKVLDAVIHSTLWILWKFRNNSFFSSTRPKRSLILNDVEHLSFIWISNKARNVTLNWIEWLFNPCNSLSTSL
ncbi:RNA-directed DNA polymerase, eukaryota, reverse transcriptase zinc-binding domain protein [Tanacetum coccineum]